MTKFILPMIIMFSISAQAADFTVQLVPADSSVSDQQVSTISPSKITQLSNWISSLNLFVQKTDILPATQTICKISGCVGSFTSASASGNYVAPVGAKYLKIRMIGGGGGGGIATNNTTSSGGGAGGYVEHILTSPSGSYAYTVGIAGTSYTAGGASTLSGTGLALSAGAGAVGQTAGTGVAGSVGGIGGAASGGQLSIPGGQGDTAKGVVSNLFVPGMGASSPLGSGGYAGGTNVGAGGNGSGFGAGGGGAANGSSSTSPGGNGAPGIIIIEERYQ